ncbi:hypothetical protein T11_7418 [Trichinella zimbabwensis]|uniref:Uncharacterized protein n=1 Tax=Trichinella zimbabwensis TaxID=268475 RepID=A0A0V1GS66_9BILA|nr:hypothetical protein T11_7800 [Trichinella zimbabwensis]KRZ01271.1 hypothetical protein T11_10152 [Trichinella zimbabwensis]KRZ03003.1 hypothetical protein T11_15844 [Trichinella zimbabwensis]KRZ06113.1 hypothetical protein T11_7418 [Trichinella zimbabwensis]
MTSGGTVHSEHANPLRLRQDVDGEVLIPHEHKKSDTLISINLAFAFQRNGSFSGLLSGKLCWGITTSINPSETSLQTDVWN